MFLTELVTVLEQHALMQAEVRLLEEIHEHAAHLQHS